ncbi:MAG TPA: 5-dehydro-4-deoxy-D-glucuronate isomerase [Thermoanaerobaculia bacterium]|nr:5-dehydro-4-deoxy-D-glucuronate isomerase [Thermoanaerobaculia bacterium]
MKVRYTADPVRFDRMSTEEIRESFLVDTLFAEDRISLVYSSADRAIVGSAVPATRTLSLEPAPELRAATFCERRELGVLNIGGPGTVTVDGAEHLLAARDGLYVGRGSKAITFASDSVEAPARYYLLSFPAHVAYPTVRIRQSEAEAVRLGSRESANQRTLYKLIHPGGARSCQLVMGFTVLEPGSVWNTMPPHTHERRMEVYLYFDLPADGRVFHFMGRPEATRHLVVAEGQAVISPAWSIHCGAGTGAYTFCWGMGGENQDFADMDPLTLDQLR